MTLLTIVYVYIGHAEVALQVLCCSHVVHIRAHLQLHTNHILGSHTPRIDDIWSAGMYPAPWVFAASHMPLAKLP